MTHPHGGISSTAWTWPLTTHAFAIFECINNKSQAPFDGALILSPSPCHSILLPFAWRKHTNKLHQICHFLSLSPFILPLSLPLSFSFTFLVCCYLFFFGKKSLLSQFLRLVLPLNLCARWTSGNQSNSKTRVLLDEILGKPYDSVSIANCIALSSSFPLSRFAFRTFVMSTW